jgi:hypothetical protein
LFNDGVQRLGGTQHGRAVSQSRMDNDPLAAIADQTGDIVLNQIAADTQYGTRVAPPTEIG